MDEHADTADVTFPAAELLMQRCIADDFTANERDHRQVASVINVPAPVVDYLQIGDAMFNKHALGLRNALKESVKILLVVASQRAQGCLFAVLEGDDFRKLLEFKLNVE